MKKVMEGKKWFYWFSLGAILIILFKFLDKFTGIASWLGNFFGILMPFICAVIVAYILFGPVNGLEKRLKKAKVKYARGISILVVYIIAGVLIFLACRFVIPAIFESITDLFKNVQNYYNSIQNTGHFGSDIEVFIQENVLKPVVNYVSSMDFSSMLSPEKILGYVTQVIGVFKGLVAIFTTIVCSVYILAQREKITGYIDNVAKSSLKESGYRKFHRYFTNGNKIFHGFVSSQCLDAFVVAVLMTITLQILGVKYSVLLGVLIGVFNLIPYFGAIIAVAISCLITVLTGGWQQALITLVVITIVQQLDANIINPRITGGALNVSPLLVIFAVSVGGAYFGAIGMFIAVPVAVLIKLMIDDHIANSKNTVINEKISKEMDDEFKELDIK